jgi:hypothetical protein
VGLHAHTGLQPGQDGGSGVGPELGTLLRMHEEAFRQAGGVPEEILYDRMKTVWLETDSRGEIVWHPVFLDLRVTGGSHGPPDPATL